jgi:hypothetical protein
VWSEILRAGIDSLIEYLSLHVITSLVPAFFVAGAIAALLSQSTILKYFGPDTKKWVSYGVASVSGAVLSVCSCTILPLFAGITRKGAGIGPATAFLFSGPAINILAIVLTARVLGLDIGVARAVSAIMVSIVVGLIMERIFGRKSESNGERPTLLVEDPKESQRPWYVTLSFFVLLIALLIIVSSGEIPAAFRAFLSVLMIAGVVILSVRYFSKEEIKSWVNETWSLTESILPLLLIGVFITGAIGGFAALYAPSHDPKTAVGEFMKPYFGNSSLSSSLLASVIGAILYMPTLLEVPVVGDLFGYTSGLMSPGAALALLLAGPSLSLPSMIALWKISGSRKASVYILLVIMVSTFMGMIFGVIKR